MILVPHILWACLKVNEQGCTIYVADGEQRENVLLRLGPEEQLWAIQLAEDIARA